jgi:hypothetical protein
MKKLYFLISLIFMVLSGCQEPQSQDTNFDSEVFCSQNSDTNTPHDYVTSGIVHGIHWEVLRDHTWAGNSYGTDDFYIFSPPSGFTCEEKHAVHLQ